MKYWRMWVVVSLVVLTLCNAVLQFWGNWYDLLSLSFIQLLCIYAGIYAYLFKKTMYGKLGGIKYEEGNTDLEATRSLGFYMYLAIYIALFFYKT